MDKSMELPGKNQQSDNDCDVFDNIQEGVENLYELMQAFKIIISFTEYHAFFDQLRAYCKEAQNLKEVDGSLMIDWINSTKEVSDCLDDMTPLFKSYQTQSEGLKQRIADALKGASSSTNLAAELQVACKGDEAMQEIWHKLTKQFAILIDKLDICKDKAVKVRESLENELKNVEQTKNSKRASVIKSVLGCAALLAFASAAVIITVLAAPGAIVVAGVTACSFAAATAGGAGLMAYHSVKFSKLRSDFARMETMVEEMRNRMTNVNTLIGRLKEMESMDTEKLNRSLKIIMEKVCHDMEQKRALAEERELNQQQQIKMQQMESEKQQIESEKQQVESENHELKQKLLLMEQQLRAAQS